MPSHLIRPSSLFFFEAFCKLKMLLLNIKKQTRDIMRGVLVGNEAKEAKIQKYKAT